MPCAITAFSVKIASPGDGAMEPVIAREVIYEWNAVHSLEEKKVLIPLAGDGVGQSTSCDVLIAFFCSSQASLNDPAPRDAEVEIEKQLQAGLPVLIYYSEARIDFGGMNARHELALAHYQKQYESRAIFGSFADEKEFRAKFARDLAKVIGTHAHFKTEAVIQSPASAVKPVVAPALAKELSECARVLLSEACEDFEAYIGRSRIGGVLKIQANGKQLIENNEPAAVAKWDAAFNELLSGGYIRDAGCNGQLFQISTKGFDFLKSIGKSPVGYIAELGGM